MEQLFDIPADDEIAAVAARARRRAWICAGLCVALLAGHGWLVTGLSRVLPLTAAEPHHLAAGMALGSDLYFGLDETVAQAPLSYYATQLGALAGVAYDSPFAPSPATVFAGRVGMLPFTMLTLGMLLVLAWRACGPIGAVAAGLCYALDPIVLGSAPLMAGDAALATGFMLTVLTAVRYLERRTLAAGIAVGFGLGIAVAASYRALVLLPVLGIAVFPWLASPTGDDSRRRQRLRPLALHGLAGLVAFLVTLHGGYGFAAEFYDPSAGGAGPTLFGHLLRPLPEPMVRGIGLSLASAPAPVAFLGSVGEPSLWYYAVALATRMPVALLVLLAISVVTTRPGAALPRPVAWVVTAALALPFLLDSLFATEQSDVRRMLPLLPLLILVAVRPVGGIWERSALGRGLLLTLGTWLVVATTSQWPHFLSAFNGLAGPRPYALFGDATMDCRLDPDRDPARQRLLARHPEAKPVGWASGPRFGTVLVHALDLWPADPAFRGPVCHWLRDFDPLDREGPFFVFRFTENHFRLATSDPDPAVAARGRRALAVALLGADQRLEVQDLLGHGADLPQVRDQLEALAAAAPDRARIRAGWLALGRHDLVLADPAATPGDRARCHFALHRYADCRRVLEPELLRRQLDAEELRILVTAQVRSRAFERAILTSESHPPLLGTASYLTYWRDLERLRSRSKEHRELLEQIRPRPPQ